jgi:hypothetical protein
MNLAKKIFITILLLKSYLQGTGQNELEGKWYSSDSTRIYSIYQNSENKTYEATIISTKNTNEQLGKIILINVLHNEEKDVYIGYMRALNSELTTKVTLKKYEHEPCLELKLSRGFFFPVRIRWCRCMKIL